jgi:hypothetical protein
MYLLARDDIDITTLAMTNEDASFPASNVLNRYTQSVAKSTTNTTTITYDSANLSDIDLYNTNAIIGTVTIKDGTTLAVLATEVLDFATATSISYATTDDVNFDKNIRAFHGDQFYSDVKVEIYLEADTGVIVSCGTVASGIFVRHGGCEKIMATKSGTKYNVTGTIQEYNAFLNKINSINEFFIHHYQTFVEGENMGLAYGIPTLSAPSSFGNTHYKYSVEVKV